MAHSRPALPHGHGEVVTQPAYDDWAAIASENASRLSHAEELFGGVPIAQLRRETRREALAHAYDYSRRLGLELPRPEADPDLIALTGHQPELFHPGVWAKYFLLDRFCVENAAVGVDLVVDTDTFDTVGISAPCLTPEVRRCAQYLAIGDGATSYVSTPVPDLAAIEVLCQAGDRMLGGLPAPALARHFAEFCAALRGAAEDAENLADLLTVARRRYEACAGTHYLELPVSRMARMRTYGTFAATLLLDADRFARDHNDELHQYRAVSGTRSAVQPFPDLGVDADWVEVPFWFIDGEHRRGVWVRRDADSIEISDRIDVAVRVDADNDVVVHALEELPLLAPRALTLTMFTRLFLGDLFVHGIGGGRYDTVTDGVIRRYVGIEPPPIVVASMTMYLPLGAHVVTDEEIAEVRQRLHRLEHNPDTMFGEAEFDDAEERARASTLAAQKASLVEEISHPNAEKKALGARIREVNAELGAILEPLTAQMREELASLEGQQAASGILTDRTYPYCLWSPLDVQDKVG